MLVGYERDESVAYAHYLTGDRQANAAALLFRCKERYEDVGGHVVRYDVAVVDYVYYHGIALAGVRV